MIGQYEVEGLQRGNSVDSTKITNASPLPDCAAEFDTRDLPIEQVGISGLSYPITVWTKEGQPQHTVGELELGVGLPPHFKGTHMSRFVEVLNRYRGELSLRTVPKLLWEVQHHLEANDAFINVTFPYFLERSAPVSKAKSLMEYICRFEAEKSGEALGFTLVVEVPVTTLCPCSKSISKYGAHSQRSFVEVAVRFSGMVWIEQIIEAVESCASSPLYALLKREDEKWVTEHAYDNPRFVEDLVREVVIAVRAIDGVNWLRVRAENMETIHKHQAYAVITWPDEQPTVEGSHTSTMSRDTAPFGQWLRERRTVNGESQSSLAASLGLSASLISRVEANEKQLSEESLEKLAGHWGLDPVTVKLQSGSIPKDLVDIIRNNPQSFVDWTLRSTQQ